MQADKFQRYKQLALASVYSEPEEGNFHSQLIPQMVNHYMPKMNLPTEARILDIGCGQGLFISEASRLGYNNCTGITLSDDDFTACQHKAMDVVKADFSDLEFSPDGVVDLIWCRHALEHSPYPILTLYEFNRVLKMGGKVYVEVPAPDCQRGHEFNDNHYSIFGLNMWIALFNRAGLQPELVDKFEFQLKVEDKDVPETYLIFILEKTRDVHQTGTHAADGAVPS